MELKTRIRDFVQKNFFVRGALEDDTSLLDQGIIDSTGVLELIGFLEDEFAFQVLDEEMLPENLDSIANLTAFVQRKQGREADARVRSRSHG
jgi:acyl carrier protein